MQNDTQHRPRLTPKGERTRARIIGAAAGLIYEHGVAGTTLDDVRTAAGVSGSQLSHYFAGKDELVQAVVTHQADLILGGQRHADLGRAEGLRAWRDMVIAAASRAGGAGGCPLGSLGSQLAESDPGPAPSSPAASSSGRPPSARDCVPGRPPGASRPASAPTTSPSPCSPPCRAAS